MQLGEVARDLSVWSENAIICARKPWSGASECVVVEPEEDGRVPSEIQRQGLVYFLEVAVAQEALEVFGSRSPSSEEKLRLLLFYAENDAYPDWVYG